MGICIRRSERSSSERRTAGNSWKYDCELCSAIYRDTETGKIYNGAALMEAGIPMPVEMGEFKAYQMHLTAEE